MTLSQIWICDSCGGISDPSSSSTAFPAGWGSYGSSEGPQHACYTCWEPVERLLGKKMLPNHGPDPKKRECA